MKIALVVPGGVDRSGTERVIPLLLWLIERLALRHQVHVFALGQEQEAGVWPLMGATVHDSGRAPCRRLRLAGAMLAEHRREEFDVVHALWAVGPGVCAALFRLWTGVPVALTLPGGELVGLLDIGYGARISWRGRAWVRLALAGANRLIVPSEWNARHARKLGHRTQTIPFGVALDRWPVRPPRKRTVGEPLRLIHVATLNRVKDQPTLLAAMARLRDMEVACRLDIAGFDHLHGSMQSLCGRLDLDDSVRFLGQRTQAELVELVASADILVMSSRHETGPVVMLEAAALGVPTVGTEVGMIADWHPDAALAVPVGDSKALAEEIARLAGDEAMRLRIAHAAQAKAVANDADAFVRAMEEVYVQIAVA